MDLKSRKVLAAVNANFEIAFDRAVEDMTTHIIGRETVKDVARRIYFHALVDVAEGKYKRL